MAPKLKNTFLGETHWSLFVAIFSQQVKNFPLHLEFDQWSLVLDQCFNCFLFLMYFSSKMALIVMMCSLLAFMIFMM